MKRFEYKLVTFNASRMGRNSFRAELDKRFQQWGNDGWELVNMERITSRSWFFNMEFTREILATFKRER